MRQFDIHMNRPNILLIATFIVPPIKGICVGFSLIRSEYLGLTKNMYIQDVFMSCYLVIMQAENAMCLKVCFNDI